ncbi:hypothetical protein ACFQ88_39240 [Paenibacillus sp. NPDC056579]|uniref:hypothetical protein n=1 Tax=Paenibacillus sp. NPDC056579 TaxID=3345871 RepID=UPI003698CAF6
MNAQLTDRLFGDSYIMLNFEITFEGVKSWFSMAELQMDDATLFRSLLMPESLHPDVQSEMLRTIVYRHEDIFFQTNRIRHKEDTAEHSILNASEPIYQLLLHMMNTRTLKDDQEAQIDLYVALQEDRLRDVPAYPTLHHLFDQKWG